MSAAFTPAPWRVEEGTTLVWGACNSPDHYGMGYPVTQARVRLGAATEYGSEFREDEAEANAHLIAAAPDYDDFTSDALPQLEVLHSTLPAGEARVAVWRVILKGRAALAKARGEQ